MSTLNASPEEPRAAIDTSKKRFPKAQVIQDIISYATNTDRPVEEVVVRKYPYFEMLTQQKPFLADTAMGLIYQHTNAPVPKLPWPVIPMAMRCPRRW